MDVNDLRITITVVSLMLFLALVVSTWSRRRKAEYDAAAMLPFMGELSMGELSVGESSAGESSAGELAPQSAPAQPARREGDAA